MVTDMKILYKDIKIGEKDKYSGAKSAWPAFYFSVKHSWDWFSHWWSFQQRPSQFSAALPITTNPSLFPGFSPYPGATKIRPRGLQGGQRNQQELVCGWQCQGMVEEGKGRRRWWEGIPEACREGGLTSKTQAPVGVSGCARGQRDGEKKREEERQAWVQGVLVDTVQARSTGSHSYWKALVAGSYCPLCSRVRVYSYSTSDPVSNQLLLKARN